MKIDLSTIFLLLLCVIPGFFAQRSRNLVCPRSFESQGATAEAGELVALGISTHGILVCLLAVILGMAGLLLGGHSVGRFFNEIDGFPFEQWASAHKTEAILAGLFTPLRLSGLAIGWELSTGSGALEAP